MNVIDKIIRHISDDPYNFVVIATLAAPLFTILACAAWSVAIMAVIATVDMVLHFIGKV